MTAEFKIGPHVSIDELDEETAIAVFGRPVYDLWKSTKSTIPADLVVTKVDCAKGEITLETLQRGFEKKRRGRVK